jgi:PiT family inorganic phosphate transporter
MDLISLSIILAALLVGLNIGANCAPNAIGVVVGSQAMPFRKAALLAAVFMFLGAALQGGPVTETIGGSLMPQASGSPQESEYAALSSLLATLVLVAVATLMSIPIAVGHAIVGSLLGVLIVTGFIGQVGLYFILGLFAAWVLTPIVSATLSFIIYRRIMVPFTKGLDLLTYNRVFSALLLAGTAFLAYSIGANNVGNVVGPVSAAGVADDVLLFTVFAGAVIGAGARFCSIRLVGTVSRGITSLGPVSAFTAQSAAALALYAFTLFGIPVSSTQAIVGALVGVGLTKGMRTVQVKTMVHILVGWVLTPMIAGLLAVMIYLMLLWL